MKVLGLVQQTGYPAIQECAFTLPSNWSNRLDILLYKNVPLLYHPTGPTDWISCYIRMCLYFTIQLVQQTGYPAIQECAFTLPSNWSNRLYIPLYKNVPLLYHPTGPTDWISHYTRMCLYFTIQLVQQTGYPAI